MIRIPKRMIVLAAFVAAGYLPARAQSEGDNRWSLQKAIDYALQHNLQVKLSALNTEVSRITLQEAKDNMHPNLTGNASENFNSGRSIDPFTNNFVNQTIWSNNFSLNSNVTLFSGFQLKNTVRRSRIDVQASDADLAKAKNDMILNIITAYMQALFNDELLATAKGNLSTSRSQQARTELLYKAGSVAETSLLEINAQVASDELNVITSENNRNIAELNLMQLLDLQDKRNFELEKPILPDPEQSAITFDAESAVVTAEQTQPEIKAASLRVSSAIKGVDVARGAYYPRLILSGVVSSGYSSARQQTAFGTPRINQIGYVADVNGNPTNTFAYAPSPVIITSSYPFSNQFSDNISEAVTLNLSIPIYNRSQARHSVSRAKINVQSATLNLEIEKNNLRKKVEQAYADAQAAQKKYVASKTQLESFGKAFKNAEIRFNNGVMNSTDFNVSKNNYTKSQSDIINAKYDYVFKLKILDFYQGKPITF